jgi:hypothetical protein
VLARVPGRVRYGLLEWSIAQQVDPALHERELALMASITEIAELAKPLKHLRDGRE